MRAHVSVWKKQLDGSMCDIVTLSEPLSRRMVTCTRFFTTNRFAIFAAGEEVHLAHSERAESRQRWYGDAKAHSTSCMILALIQ